MQQPPIPPPVTELFSAIARSGPPLFFPQPDVPIAFNFDQGLAAPETFPAAALLDLAQYILQRDGADALEYFDAQTGYEELVFGYKGLRAQLARRYRAAHGCNLDERGFILTSGSVQAIAMAVNGFVDAGEVVVAEAASFPYALRYMEMAGAEVRTVPVDGDGMDIDALERLLAELDTAGKRVKMVYTIATFQLPTGAELSLPRRRRLIELAKRHRFVVLEDNVYGELRFAGAPLPSLLSLDDSGLVMQCNAFSKTIAPGLRLGWMAGHPDTIAALAAVRQDLGVSQWLSRIMAEFLARDLFDAHLARANAVYASKCATAVNAVRRYCGEFARFREPNGSFYLWLEIDERVDWQRAAQLAAQQGIFFRPGERFMNDTQGRQFLRLAYSHVDERIIADGIEKLGAILHQCQR
jgi:2-aminoadipate transaminase